MHGGAFLSCVPWCYNLALANHLIDTTGPVCGDGDDADPDTEAVGIPTSLVGGGGLCCFCGFNPWPWEDPEWTIAMPDPLTKHTGSEGGHGEAAGCSPDSCYNLNGCWNNGHMCAQHLDGTCDATGMCCG